MWTRAELKNNAKAFFKYNYWKMVLAALVLAFVGGGGGGFSFGSYSQGGGAETDGASSVGMVPSVQLTSLDVNLTTAVVVGILVAVIVVCVVVGAIQWFVFNPLTVGAQRFFVVSHYRKAELGELGFAFSRSYLNIVKIMFQAQMYVFLWSLLLVIPGIIKTYEYMMIPYILAENPDIDSKEAFAMSKQMMAGNKWKAFVLELSFFGWILLSTLTCGMLSIFWVNPYMYMTLAELYVALKEITYGAGPNPYVQNSGSWDGGRWNSGSQNQWSGGDQGQWNGQNQQGGQWNGSSQNQWNGSGQGQWNGNNPGQWSGGDPNQGNGAGAQQPNNPGQWNQPDNGNWN